MRPNAILCRNGHAHGSIVAAAACDRDCVRPIVTLEVRCCCQPTKLLGYLDVEVSRAQVGTTLHYALATSAVNMLAADAPAPSFARLSLPVKELVNEGRSYPAISSEETPLDVLRRIPGFRDARPMVR